MYLLLQASAGPLPWLTGEALALKSCHSVPATSWSFSAPGCLACPGVWAGMWPQAAWALCPQVSSACRTPRLSEWLKLLLVPVPLLPGGTWCQHPGLDVPFPSSLGGGVLRASSWWPACSEAPRPFLPSVSAGCCIHAASSSGSATLFPNLAGTCSGALVLWSPCSCVTTTSAKTQLPQTATVWGPSSHEFGGHCTPPFTKPVRALPQPSGPR